jgi:hypothetical protein
MAESLEEKTLQEGILSRAGRDTKTCIHHWLFWAVEFFGGGAMAMISPALGLIFVASVLVAILIVNIALAPVRQRDEARGVLRAERESQIQSDRQPDIVYDDHGETTIKHGDGESYQYTHLWFRNRPTGRPAYDVAARITVWSGDGAIRQLFSSEGKWMGVSHDQGVGIHQINTMNLLPNDASHGLDLFIRPRGAPDCYVVFADSVYRGFRRKKYCVPPSYYYVKVTLACEGYTHDFRFSVRNNEQDQPIEIEQVTDDGFFWE